MFYLFNKSRFIGIKLCKPTEKYNITILHGEEEQEILRCFEVTFCIVVTQSDHFWGFEKIKSCKQLAFNAYRILSYTEDYLFSNQFMEDLGRIYQLRKYFPSFDDDVCQSSIPSSDDSGL